MFGLKKRQVKIQDLFVLYNNYRNTEKVKSLEYVNNYFISNKLSKISFKNKKRPLYIDNIKSLSYPYKELNTSKISIIITAYNEEVLLKYALMSLLNQTYKNIEIIFVDDQSSDNTMEVFKRYCQDNSFKNYKIIRVAKNNGPFITRNIGIKYATGNYITFHDADDWAHPQRLEEQVKVLEGTSRVASISELVRIKPNGELFSKNIYPLNRIAMVSLMIKREVLDKLGFFYTDLLGGDSEYLHRIKYFYGNEKVKKVRKVLTFAAHRPNSRTTSEVTGTPGFGINPLREKHWQILEERLFEMVNAYKSYNVEFDERKYEYEIIK